VPLTEARARRFATDWSTVDIPRPSFLGTKVLDDFPLAELVPYIDWSPFFLTWELKGKFPKIFEDPSVGAEARKLYDDAQQLLRRILDEKLLIARGVYGFWPANSVEDEILVFDPDAPERLIVSFPMLRQQWERPGQDAFRSLADYIAPRDSGRTDYLGAFAVTAGIGCDELARHFEQECHDDYHAIMAKALADRLAEAFAEKLHWQARQDWGYGRDEQLSQDDLIAERYRGIRPAYGYPACPDHTEKRKLFDLLDAERRVGIRLTESYAMHPAASVSGLYFAHPAARYFSVDKISQDQVIDYARRKGVPVSEIERWLSPNLGYHPSAE
jgi:5-methyltetrahydrofolate--homocysteine methyltransferase